jgi:hypothetical protein
MMATDLLLISPGLRDVTEQPVELLLKVDLSACATDEARATAHLQASKALSLADLPAARLHADWLAHCMQASKALSLADGGIRALAQDVGVWGGVINYDQEISLELSEIVKLRRNSPAPELGMYAFRLQVHTQ